MSVQIEILKPEANRELQKLAARNLISIRPDPVDGFEALLAKIRARVKKAGITPRDIAKEVEIVRSSRYVRKKR